MATQPIPCAVCSESLVNAITPDEVVTIHGHRIRFRRRTDFVMCQRCLSLYRVRDLRAGRVEPITDDRLLAEGEAEPMRAHRDREPGGRRRWLRRRR